MKRVIILGLAAGALAAVWARTPERQRRYLANIVRQLPQLPGRYAV